ncbi:MAG: M81 family metallopeptidase [Hyphomicrobiaceae bacterium]
MQGPRVAIVGVWLESNRQAPIAGEADLEGYYLLEGAEILAAARAPQPVIMGEAAAFVKAMDATGPWVPLPILLAGCHPHGPVAGTLMDRFLDIIRARLQAAGPVDAVYIANHGAMLATNDEDPDGSIIALVRYLVGPGTKIVVTLNLHGNISDRMVEASDLIVGYRTNPHVDMTERGEEAALGLRLILAGLADPKAALIRLPITPAPIALLTADGPYGDLIDFGTRRRAELAGEILNVSIFGGFVFADCAKNGIAVVVTARRDIAHARSLAREIAARCWADRKRFVKTLTPLKTTVEMARSSNRQPLIVAECADNPGGGGTGRCTVLLASLVKANAGNVLYGSFYDPPLAAQAHELGVGAHIRAEFNRTPGLPCDQPFSADVEVVGLHHGTVVGRLGYAQGRTLILGLSAALRIGGTDGITVVVISQRIQSADPMFFEMFGLDIGRAATVVVKSRGHFRSGFLPRFLPEQVIEVDTEGLTSPALDRRQWHGLPRPVYPLDEHTSWSAPQW